MNILNKEKFCQEVQDFVVAYNVSYMEAVLELCDKKDLEYELASNLLNRQIIEKIEAEAAELNLIKKESTLDF